MALRRMLVSARHIGVPRKTERSDVLWGESLADLFKTVTHFYGYSLSLDNNPPNISPFRQWWVAQRKSEVNEKNFCLKFVYISKAKVERFQPWLYFCVL